MYILHILKDLYIDLKWTLYELILKSKNILTYLCYSHIMPVCLLLYAYCYSIWKCIHNNKITSNIIILLISKLSVIL